MEGAPSFHKGLRVCGKIARMVDSLAVAARLVGLRVGMDKEVNSDQMEETLGNLVPHLLRNANCILKNVENRED